MTNRKASASLRSGLITASDDVHGRIHDDPHYVDEVPVDPRDLDAVVVRRGVVTAERAGRRKGEQGQPDEDVCAVEPPLEPWGVFALGPLEGPIGPESRGEGDSRGSPRDGGREGEPGAWPGRP